MNRADPTILVVGELSDAAIDRLRAAGTVSVVDTMDEARLVEAVADVDALVVRTRTVVTRRVLDGAGRLRVIGRAGVGLENIDVAYARAKGVQVVYTPGAATNAVADLTLGLMLALLRNIPGNDRDVRAGNFLEARRRSVAHELSELTLGIVGMGRIGKAVARRCVRGFGMKVLYNDIEDVGPLDIEATSAGKTDLFAQSDIVTLHVPLTDETRKLINTQSLICFKPTGMLINTARGGIVDSDALAVALQREGLGGAGLDVVDPEPPPADHPLFAVPNVVFSPHVGSRSHTGLARMQDVVDDVIRVLRGQAARSPAS